VKMVVCSVTECITLTVAVQHGDSELSIVCCLDRYVYYCMKYINNLLSFGIKPIMVFDGCRLPSKQEVEKSRREYAWVLAIFDSFFTLLLFGCCYYYHQQNKADVLFVQIKPVLSSFKQLMV